MAVGMFRSVDNVKRKIKKRYRSVGNVTREVKKRYRNVGNVVHLTYRANLIAEFHSEHSGLTKTSYQISDGGRTLSWDITSTESTEQKSHFMITKDGGFPNEITVSYTTTHGYGAIVIMGDDWYCLKYGDYNNAICHVDSCENKFFETTISVDNTNEYLIFAIEAKNRGQYTGSITNLTINGESVEFVI